MRMGVSVNGSKQTTIRELKRLRRMIGTGWYNIDISKAMKRSPAWVTSCLEVIGLTANEMPKAEFNKRQPENRVRNKVK